MGVQENNRMIAIYMGLGDKVGTAYTINKSLCRIAENAVYHKDLNQLYQVAKKLKKELYKLLDAAYGKDMIYYTIDQYYNSLINAAITFEIAPLYEAVVSGIEFLNKQKEV